MAFFDMLKNKAAQAAQVADAKAVNNLGQSAKQAISGATNKTYTVTLSGIPANLAELQAMPEGALKQPEHTAALTVAALCMYPVDKEASFEMLNFLHGPRGLTSSDRQFIADRFRDKDYVPRSYFEGATPDNNYEPSEPLTIKFFENPYARQNIDEGYLTLQVESGGADSPRQIRLRTKPSTGEWFLWEQFILSDIRPPKSADPWA
jgi:hypothetical protein